MKKKNPGIIILLSIVLMVCLIMVLLLSGYQAGQASCTASFSLAKLPQTILNAADKKYDGLSFHGNYTHPEALDVAREYDDSGDWVCVNAKNMDYERAVTVCKHEVGHELVAEILEKDDIGIYKEFENLLYKYANETNGN